MYAGGNGVASSQYMDYRVVLVFPGFGAEREQAETIVESALCWINTYRERPGFRFADQVSAHLELAQDADANVLLTTTRQRVGLKGSSTIPNCKTTSAIT